MSNYRAPIRTIQTDWRTGEVDPAFAMRVDSTALSTGARSLRNMMVRATGGAERRPGMTTLATLPARVRMIEFEFDANEKYICAFGPFIAYLYTAAGVLVSTLGSCPWNSTTTWELTVVQRGDVMVIAHTAFQPRRIRRTGLNSFVLETLEFSSDIGGAVPNQPFTRYTRTTVSVKVGAIFGITTVTADSAIFNSGWVGEHIRIFGNDILLDGYVSSTVMNCSIRQTVQAHLGIAPIRTYAGAFQIEITHVDHGMSTGAVVTISGAVDMPGILAVNINGTYSIAVIDSDHYEVITATGSTLSGDGGGSSVTVRTTDYTKSWDEQLWSDRHGWPGAVALHENRLWLGGSVDSPTFLAGSAVGDYYDFNVRDGLDDDSVQGVISATTRILHLASHRQLQIFCESTEAVVETSSGEPITPGSLKVINQTAYGCDPNVRPRVFDGAVLFAQRNGKNVRMLTYDLNTDAQVALPVSILASHIVNRPNDVAVLLGTPTRPEQYAFFINTDGSCAVFHSIASEKLNAWTHFTAGNGYFDSVCVVGTTVFFSVRHSDGLYYLERLELDLATIWLDGAYQVAGSGIGWYIGTRFANTNVTVMFNRWSLGVYPVDGTGHISIPFTTGTITVGYDYGIEVIPYPPDKEMTDGGMTGEKRRIVSSTLHFQSSVSAAVNGTEVLGFTIGQNPALPPVAITGKKRVRHFGYDRDPVVTITQPNPGPLLVLGMTQEVSI